MDSTLSINSHVTSKRPRVALVEITPQKASKPYDPSLMLRELHTQFETLSSNPDLEAIVLAISGTPVNATRSRQKQLLFGSSDISRVCIRAIQKSPIPVICATSGPCHGLNLALACACNLRMSASDTSFRISDVNNDNDVSISVQGLSDAIGGSGCGWLHEVALRNRPFDASEALRVGLVNSVWKTREDVEREALEMARLIALRGRKVTSTVKDRLIPGNSLYGQYISDYSEAEAAADLDQAMGVGSLLRMPRIEKL